MSATTGTRRALRLAFFAVAFALGAAVSCVAVTRAADRTALIPSYSALLRTFNVGLSQTQARDMAEHVLLLSSYYSLDPGLLVAVVATESGWRVNAVSPAGAQGLGQLMPATASGLAVLPFEKYENLDGTARYLRRLLNRFADLPMQTRYERAIAGYNAGPEAVARYGGIPPYAETRTYVVRVLALWRQIGSMMDNLAKPAAPVAVETAPQPPPAPQLPHAPQLAASVPLSPAPHRVALAPAKPKPVVDARPVWSIALAAPVFVADGEPIPVSLRVHGSGTVILTAKIGPTIVERRAISSAMSRVMLHPLPAVSRTRMVMLQASAPGVRSRETLVAAVAPTTRSAFVTP